MDEKTKNFLLYVAKNHSVVTRTSLMKLAYLIDYVSTQNNGNKITIFEYVRYYFGPFDSTIYGYLESLEQEGLIIPSSQYDDRVEYITYHVGEEALPNMEGFTKEEMDSINGVLTELKGFGPKALTKIAYNTPPMRAIGATLENKEGLNQELDLRLSKQ